MRFCTIANPGELVHAQVLARGLAEHHPDAHLSVFEGEGVPTGLRRLLEDGADLAVYLDPAVDVRATLRPVLERGLERRFATLTPGAALVAVDASPEAAAFLDWWDERLRAADGGAVWADLAPSVFAGVSVLDDRGCAVSHRNLGERTLELEGGSYTVDGRVLRFAHFEGFDPARPHLLKAGAMHVRTSANPALAALCESYAQRLREAGWTDPRRRADVGREMPDGAVFDDRLSHLLADAADAGERFDPFDPDQHEAFMCWLEGPAPHGARVGVNRFLYGTYREREDLQRAYPDLDGAHGEGFAGWAWVFGRPEMGIPERFLPPRPPGLTTERPADEKTAARPPLPRGPRPDLSMNVTGLLTGTLGLGEAARGYVRALQAAGLGVSTSSVDVRQFVQIGAVPHEDYAQVAYEHVRSEGDAGFNLICINADELPTFADSMPPAFLERPSIGVWAWETDHLPERWSRSYGLLDEIWVYSRYVAENLGRVAPFPVTRIPPPVSPPVPGDVELDLGVPGGFQFLFMFDFFSTIARKNPVGLIAAFRRAFEPGEGPRLVVKTINGVHRPDALDEVLWAARGRPDVHVVDRSLSAPERDALVAGCDCYVSLHRSEGFGLTLAECMALGKPVIATRFSAPTDYMTDDNSYPVPYGITHVGPDAEIYPAEGTWADPDLDEAARLMRRVVEQPAEAAAKGEVARRDIERLYSPKAVGDMIRARLDEIRGLWG